MARDIKLIIKGDNRSAEAALKELERTGSGVAHALERDFDQLGTKSGLVFDNKRKSAQDAYNRIKKSGMTSADDLAAAEQGLARRLKSIDKQQYGERLSMAQKFRNNAGKIAAAAGVAYAAIRIGTEAIEEASVFQTALVDLGKVGVENLGAVRAEIMAMPGELGSATELIKGYYQVISAGVTDPKKAMDLLTTAAKASKAAHVDQSEVIKGLTKVMAGYGGAVETAADAADLLFGIEKLGQTSVAELVPVIGDLAAISHQVGVSQYEMGAALSQVTQTAGSTSQAATQYRAILIGLLKPQKTMQEALDSMGYSSGQAAIQALGLSGTLTGLAQYAETSGVGMAKLFESSEALTALGPLLASQFSGYNAALSELKNNSGAAEQAFIDWQATFEATETLFKNTIGKVMIELGTQLAPQVQEAMRGIAGWITDSGPEIVQFFKGLGIVIEGVSKTIGLFVDGVRLAAEAAAEVSLQVENLQNFGNIGQGTRDISSVDPTSPFAGVFSGVSPFVNANGEPLAVGTSYVPRTGLYQLHRGEQVKTRGEAAATSTGSKVSIGGITVNLPAGTSEQNARETARQLIPELRRLGLRVA
jgi:TP901 family phage tail tape measure protein